MPGYELIGKEERDAVNKIFDDGGILFHRAFENIRKNFFVKEVGSKFETYFDSEYCSAVSSGTAAVKCALKAAGIKQGDEVITQAFNFVACVEAIVDLGAKPVICNVDDNLHLDLQDLESKITKNTKAILAVHMLGLGGPIFELKNLCHELNILLIEDACEIIGGLVEDKYLGTIGDIGIFSLDFAKNITCGEGGITLTNCEEYGTYIKQYIDHGHENNPNLARGHDNRVMPGFNFRMTEMQAAIAAVQLDKLDYIIKNNQERYMLLNKIIGSKASVRLELNGHKGSYDTFIFSVEDELLRKKIINKLIKLGIGTKILPDAMEWHCASYWGHMLDQEDVNHSIITQKKLEKNIAIPILLKTSLKEYEHISNCIIDEIN